MKYDYNEFLKNKQKKIIESGFEVKKLNNHLFPFQDFIVKRALKAGKYAIFADTGLGKTIMQLEWAHQVEKHTKKAVLILAPLAVNIQTIEEGNKFGIEVLKLDVHKGMPLEGIWITNYEQIDNIGCNAFSGIVLDESSILKNEMGKFRNKLIESFKETPYKLCCTATPSPNDPMELGNHTEFLDVMNYNEMLAMYFVHDGGETSKWRLKGHAVERFYEFVSTWAIMLMKPHDIGFEQTGYELPPLKLHEVEVQTQTPEGMLFGGLAVNATDFNRSLRGTESLRIDKVFEIVKSIPTGEQLIIWCKQNQEASEIYKKLTSEGYDCRNIQGSDSPEKKEEGLIGFAHGLYQILITKTQIASFGLNFQNCHYQVFSAIDFSFESTYQAIRRSYRFGQLFPVNIWMITTDRMINVIKSIYDKEKSFKKMQSEMTQAISKNLNNEIMSTVEFQEDIKTDLFWVMKGDCVQRSKEVPDKSVDLSVFSPPFASLYTYSSHTEDMGNSTDFDQFGDHFKFLIPEIKRVLKPGRICAVHCQDLPIQKGKEGYIGLRDFSGMLVKWFTEEGFIYHSKITLWKDPVIEMQRTKALGLLHKQLKKDSVMSRVGLAEYVLIFRNEGDNETPITNINIPVEYWQKIASPIWYDIDYGNTLNYREGKIEQDEKHICPLSLDTIERIVLLYSNPGEVVFSPFGGIGSEGYQALKMKRKSISIELKESYFNLNCRNHRGAYEESFALAISFD
jgi:DNA modification methylase